MSEHYLYRVVLPSVELPRKPTYSVVETMKILGCSRRTFYKKVGMGEIVVTKDKRIYIKEIEKYFDHCNADDCISKLKFTET